MGRTVNQPRGASHEGAPHGRGYGRHEKHGLARLVVYLPPWLAWLLIYLLAVLIWFLWGQDYDSRPWFSVGDFVCTVVGVIGTWRYAEPRGEMLRFLATGTTALAGMWLMFAGILGPFTRPIPDLYFGFGLAICVFWTMRRALLGDGDRVVAASGTAGRLVEALKGARLGQPKTLEVEGGVVVETPIEVNRGEQTIAELQQKVKVLEATIPGLRPGSMRIQQDPHDAGWGTLVTVPKDPLEGTQVWPGPSAPGQSVHLGAPVGPYETGGVARLFITGDDKLGRALAHWLVMGMAGAGKSSAMRMVVADLLSRIDFQCWAHDHVKGLQTLAPLLGGLDWVTMDLPAGKKMLCAVRAAIRARADHLGRRGLEQWEPGCGLTLLMVWLEEATDLGDLESLKQLVREARSTGIVIFVSMQRASHDNVDTTTRSQFGGGWCFGVRDTADAGFCLPDVAIEAGAAPERWQNAQPGYNYLTGPGIPVEFWPVPIRAWRATNQQLEAAVEAGKEYRQPLDEVTAAAVRDLGYGDRPDPLSFLALSAPPRRPGTDVAQPGEGELVDDDDEDQAEDHDPEEMSDMPEDLDPHITADPDQPVAPLDVDVPLGDPNAGRQRLTTEEAQRVIQVHLAAIVRNRRDHTTAADIHRMRPATTRTREWVRLELIRLESEAAPHEYSTTREADDPPGVFHIAAPRTVRELADTPA
jgi:hypothetical protein